jgi:hypothetical protein
VITSSSKTKHKYTIYVRKAKPISNNKLVIKTTNNKKITLNNNLGKKVAPILSYK